MTDEELARLRAHDSNISRYQRLLKTKLSDLERQFLERRLTEERSAAEGLGPPPPTHGLAQRAQSVCLILARETRTEKHPRGNAVRQASSPAVGLLQVVADATPWR